MEHITENNELSNEMNTEQPVKKTKTKQRK